MSTMKTPLKNSNNCPLVKTVLNFFWCRGNNLHGGKSTYISLWFYLLKHSVTRTSIFLSDRAHAKSISGSIVHAVENVESMFSELRDDTSF